MKQVKLFILNNKRIFFIIFLILIFCFAILLHNLYFKNSDIELEKDTLMISSNIVYTPNEINVEKSIEKVVEFISVDIKGEVKKPGVYRIDTSLDRRINDVISMAGGLTTKADTSVTNLSKKLFDEMVIIIYSKDEVSKFSETKEIEQVKNNACLTNNCDSCITNVENNTNNNENSLININTATKDELMTLSGIGESKALSIIEYRQINKFTKIEDIMNVSGIGESAFAKIKDYITV